MPRRPAWNPVALASTVVSMDSFVASAKEVTFRGVLVVLFGKCPLGVGGPVVVDHALEIARGHRTKPQRPEIAKEGHRHSRFIPVRMGDHHPGLVCLRLQDRAEQRIELGVDQDHMLAVVERIEHHMRCRLDRARHFHEHINGIAGGQHRRIVGQHSATRGRLPLPLRERTLHGSTP